MNRAHFYDAVSLALLIAAIYFFYEASAFLVDKDYVAACIVTVIGALVGKGGVEVGKLALFRRRRG